MELNLSCFCLKLNTLQVLQPRLASFHFDFQAAGTTGALQVGKDPTHSSLKDGNKGRNIKNKKGKKRKKMRATNGTETSETGGNEGKDFTEKGVGERSKKRTQTEGG